MTYSSTLQRLPGTRLSEISKSDASYDSEHGEYFFDRNAAIFEHILDYYRNGELHFPHCICGPNINKELDFWGLDENSISPCCWKAYSSYDDEKKTVLELAKTLGLGEPASFQLKVQSEDPDTVCPSNNNSPRATEEGCKGFRNKLWKFLEKPQSSKAAKVGKHPIPKVRITNQ